MIDLRPIVYVLGRILIVLAILMLAPAIIDHRAGLANGMDFLESAIITGAIGALLALATANAVGAFTSKASLAISRSKQRQQSTKRPAGTAGLFSFGEDLIFKTAEARSLCRCNDRVRQG